LETLPSEFPPWRFPDITDGTVEQIGDKLKRLMIIIVYRTNHRAARGRAPHFVQKLWHDGEAVTGNMRQNAVNVVRMEKMVPRALDYFSAGR
jgi:hypothetical protein